jgi:hypothetical protein
MGHEGINPERGFSVHPGRHVPDFVMMELVPDVSIRFRTQKILLEFYPSVPKPRSQFVIENVVQILYYGKCTGKPFYFGKTCAEIIYMCRKI